MSTAKHRYAVTVCRRDGSVLGRFRVEPDWGSVCEWARFAALRGGVSSARAMQPVCEPVWHPAYGEPVIATVQARFGAAGPDRAGAAVYQLSRRYFRALAESLSPCLVKQGLLQEGEGFRYFFTAAPATDGEAVATDGEAAEQPRAAFVVEQTDPEIRLHPASCRELRNRAVHTGPRLEAGDYAVFIPLSVLEEIQDLTQAAGAMETGGVLVGRLCRDVRSSEVFAVAAAQIPAGQTRAEITRLTFTAEAWMSLLQAARARAADEIWLGWWHSHSYMQAFCKDCKERESGACRVDAAFMSEQDCVLHRTCFPAAFSLAIVVSNSPCTGLSWHLFGWRDAVISPRGFFILDSSGRARAAASSSKEGD